MRMEQKMQKTSASVARETRNYAHPLKILIISMLPVNYLQKIIYQAILNRWQWSCTTNLPIRHLYDTEVPTRNTWVVKSGYPNEIVLGRSEHPAVKFRSINVSQSALTCFEKYASTNFSESKTTRLTYADMSTEHRSISCQHNILWLLSH